MEWLPDLDLANLDLTDVLIIVIIVTVIFVTIYLCFFYEKPEPITYNLVSDEMRLKYQDHEPRFNFEETDTYFINLDRAEKRRENVYRQCQEQGLSVKRFPAIDGQKISLDDPQYAKHLKHMRWWYEQEPKHIGHFACFLSHLAIYKQFLQSDKEFCLILEDDVEFVTPTFKADVIRHMRHVPEDWDIVLLGYHIDNSDGRVKKGNKNTRLVNNILNLTYFTGTHGYIINRRSAKILFTHLQAHEWVIDWNMAFLSERGLLKIYGVYTPLVCQPAVYEIKVNGLKYTQNCKRDMGGMETTFSL